MTTATAGTNQAVADLWFQWLETVRKIVEPTLAIRKLSPQDYRNLHNALVKGCQDDTVTDDDLISKLQQIKRIVSPWVTYDSLATADRRFLGDVLKQAEPINTTMRRLASNSKRNAGRSRKGRRQLTVWIIAFAIGLGAGLFIIFGEGSPYNPLGPWFQRLILRGRFAMSRFSTLQIFGAVSAIMLLFAAPLMYRTKKS